MEEEMNLQKANHYHRLVEWSRRVESCRSSGVTVGQWCQENGIAVSTYYSWQKKVFQALNESQETAFAEVLVMEGPQSSEQQVTAVIEVSGVRIQVYEGADAATLQAVFLRLFDTAIDVREETLDDLRRHCINNVKKTSGSVLTKDAVRFQNGLDS